MISGDTASANTVRRQFSHSSQPSRPAIVSVSRISEVIAVVAALVSLAYDLLGMLLVNTIMPAIESAIQSTVPPPKSPDPTGGIRR